IPEGYGAGIVMLWDEGTWTPESEDVDAALKKGDLKFTLDGFKLKGSWVLVRTRGWGGSKRGGSTDDGRSWLLIKHRDEWAGEVGQALSRAKHLTVDWEKFADAWRADYAPSMNRVRTGELPWTTLDRLNRIILDRLLVQFRITGLSEADIEDFNRVWHRLKPW